MRKSSDTTLITKSVNVEVVVKTSGIIKLSESKRLQKDKSNRWSSPQSFIDCEAIENINLES
jgi:hypothetical protein